MSKQNLTQRGLVGMALVLFLGGGFVSGGTYWIQKYDYVAKVDKKTIRSVDYLRKMEQNKQVYASLPDAETLLKSLTINELIEREIQLLEAEKQILQVSPQELEQEWAQILNASYQGDRERMLRSLHRIRYSEQAFNNELSARILIRKTQEALTSGVQVPEEKLKAHYLENKKNFQRPEQIEAKHILFKVDNAQPQNKPLSLKKAEKTLSEVKNGLSFEDAAKKYSEDESSAKQGGSLGAFGKGDMVPAFENAVWNLQPGQMTDVPIETEYGYHLIQRGKNIPAGDIPFAEARPIFEARLRVQEQQEHLKNWLEKQKKSLKIEINPKYQENTPSSSPSNESVSPPVSASP